MQITYDNFQNFFSTLSNQSEINLDGLRWIEPCGALAFKTFYEINNKPNLRGVVQPGPRNYLKTLMSSDEIDTSKSYLPILKIRKTKSEEISKAIVEKIIGKANSSINNLERVEDLKKYLQYIISEILNNVIDHSHTSECAYVAVQTYSAPFKTQVAISDNGIGIKGSLEGKFGTLASEIEAIKKSLEPFITSAVPDAYGNMKNAGVGLSMTSRLVELTFNKIKIISYDGMCSIENGQTSYLKLDSSWPGCFVCFEIEENKLVQEFEELKGYVIEEMNKLKTFKNINLF